jgi:hypothetical protein
MATEPAGFRLMHMDKPAHNWGELRGVFPTLQEAMDAAGHPDPTHWVTATGAPDRLFIDWIHYADDIEDLYGIMPWSIHAPGVADHYTDLLTADVVAERN